MVPIKFGTNILELNIPEKNLVFNLSSNDYPHPKDAKDDIRQSLHNPVGCRRLRDIVHKDATVVILGDDRTRLTPQHLIVPVVLEELYNAGLQPNQIKLIIACGTHRQMMEREIEEKYGRELMNEIEIKNHNFLDVNNLANKGVTRRGTRILVNKEFLQADIRIGIGSVLPHHPTGWSGGAKILLPGIAGEETTCDMHLLGATEQQLGKIDTPCRKEMEDFAENVGLHFIVNVILDEKGNILKSIAGHFIKAHREAVKWGIKVFGVEFREQAELTLSSPYPMDYDLTQSDKGLFSAEIVTKKGGEIILLSPCLEGIAPTHGEEIAKLAGYDDDTLWNMLKKNQIKDRFAASENMYLNHIKKNFKATLMMDPVLCNIMGFYYLNSQDLNKYLNFRLDMNKNLKIGIINQSTEVLPILAK
ncbi:nickel-dependent lactate racemase [candidate division KSB1 bacterium]|nr:nickel-dependent lactate racemase [candidate division KSB1 bacterium]